jgi:hypothetical protein
MCRYSYDYYAACKHTELVLLGCCSKAQDAPTAELLSTVEDGKSDDGVATDLRREGVSSELKNDRSPSISSTASPQQHHQQDSSIEHGSVSITAEPGYGCTSSSASHPSHSSFTSNTVLYDMAAGLPLFGQTFRSWMGGPTVTSPKQTNVESHGHVFMSSKRSIEAVSRSHPADLCTSY